MKVMFMCAVVRPRWDSHANRHFDGKIGIWPFIFKDPREKEQQESSSRYNGNKVHYRHQPGGDEKDVCRKVNPRN